MSTGRVLNPEERFSSVEERDRLPALPGRPRLLWSADSARGPVRGRRSHERRSSGRGGAQTGAGRIYISTIYRNLEELEQFGIISHSHLGHGPSSYLLASHAHAHFMCAECGKMIEAPDDIFRGLARAAKAKLGFSIDPKHFAILGRCGECSLSSAP